MESFCPRRHPMLKRFLNPVLLLSASLMLFACAGEKLDLEVKATMDGQPAAQAKVTVDGKEEGVTDANGLFTKVIRKKPGADVEVVVAKEQAGYRIQPWKGSFLMKLPKSGTVDKYSFEANLAAMRYVTIVATEKGTPVADAVVKAAGQEAGKTDAKGEFVYEYKELPSSGIDLAVSKPGYAVWRKTGAVEPGQRLEAAMSKRVTVTVATLMEEYGQSAGIPGVAVFIDKKQVGKTDRKGAFSYSYDGEPGKKVSLALSAPGFIPESWKTTVTLEGEVNVQRYFYPTTPKSIRAGIYRFVSNTPGADLKEVLGQTETAVASQLFKYSCFREVPTKALQAEMKQARLNIEKITVKGWRETPLKRTVDMIILGSVAKDDKGFLIETKFYTSGGKLLLSQITRARDASGITSAAKEIANAVIEKFPFEGTVVAVDGERYRLNLGKGGYRISRGTDFALMAARLDEAGRVSSYREIGKLRVKKAEENGSWAEIEDLKKGEKVGVGDRVVRRIYREEEEAAKNFFVLSVKGGVPPDVSPLGGVNIYLNQEWIGSTGPDGKAEVPVKLGKKYDMVLYRHGYQQHADKLRIEKNREAKDFVLQVNNSIFKIDSQPQSAEVSVDGEKIGKTPILDGKQVTLGFHTVKVSVGGDYRDWEEVVEFATKVEDRTGDRKIILHKDYLKIGERAEQKDDIEGAIQAYQSTGKGHPDYSVAHRRLAQIYLDRKNDYDAAIREFENVLTLPENQQLVYKQFAVDFTNLGHAYYERGNALVPKDREAAAQAFAKAIQNLQVAKQNTRFFPNDQYDEAVHDTYYYTALSYHKLYQITRKNTVLNSANLAWREYFDFFPKSLEGKAVFDESREAARKYWDQIKDLM
jgi:tetratricopeptide (TPR) repeat protein